jgi:hypothetical protein
MPNPESGAQPQPDPADINRLLRNIKQTSGPGAGLLSTLESLEVASAGWAALDSGQLIDTLLASSRILNQAHGRILGLTREFHNRVYSETTNPGSTVVQVSDIEKRINCELGFALHHSGRATGDLIGQAMELAGRLPKVHQAMLDGLLDRQKGWIYYTYLGILDDDLAQRAVDLTLQRALTQTSGQLAYALAKLIIQLDPAGAEERRRRAERRRGVYAGLNPDGTANLGATNLPADQAIAARQHIRELAELLQADDDDRPMSTVEAEVFIGLLNGRYPGPQHQPDQPLQPDQSDQPEQPEQSGVAGQVVWDDDDDECCVEDPDEDSWADRRDLRERAKSLWWTFPEAYTTEELVALEWLNGVGWLAGVADPERTVAQILAGRSRHRTRGGVHLSMTLETLALLEDNPGLVSGWGAVTAEIARSLAQTLEDQPWDLTVYDPTNPNVPVHQQALRRRPQMDTIRFVRTRDNTCRAPNCQVPANRCDIDHQHPHAQGGPTTPGNLACQCKRHHTLKHSPGWDVRQDPEEPGDLLWTTPNGHTYRTSPEPLFTLYTPPNTSTSQPPEEEIPY